MKRESNYKTRKISIIMLVVLIVLLVFSVIFVGSAKNSLENEKRHYLLEISTKNAMLIEVKVDDLLNHLRSLSAFVGGAEYFNPYTMFEQLKEETRINEFKRMGYILKNGHSISTDGADMDLSHRDYFTAALNGESVISDRLLDFSDGNGINVFATPIIRDGEVQAVLFGTKSTSSMSELLDVNSFSGNGYSYIIKKDGTPMLFSTNENGIGEFANFFDLLAENPKNAAKAERMKADFESGTSNNYCFYIHGKKYELGFSKINTNDWYVISLVPSEVISEGSEELVQRMIISSVIIMVVAVGMCFIVIASFRRANNRLRDFAFTDSVTGRSNWRKFNIDADGIIPGSPPKTYAIAVFDIKKFKIFNATYNFSGGNLLLKFIANVITNNLSDGEYFSRVAADSFCMLLKYESKEKIIKRIERISEQISRFTDNYQINLSFGVCIVDDTSLSAAALHDCAIIAKQTIKHKASTNYAFYDEPVRSLLLEESDIENCMETALLNKEFEVYLQPKYRFDTEKIVGAEALVRWNRPGKGLVFPDSFIPIFERTGFIKKLDIYMFENTCALLKKWRAESPSCNDLVVSVNFSRVNLNEDNLPLVLLGVAEKHGVPCKNLEIELTESVVVGNYEKLISMMKELKSFGFILSIDDFGSGYSSLNALKNLPVDIIKLDKAFLDEATDNERAKIIISNLIEMTKELSLFTVAEGVETAEQVEFLKDAGCDIAQGYYYSKPVPVAEFERLLTEQNRTAE